MAQAGPLGSRVDRRYQMRPHSIRKFFRTQMAALGVQTDYIEYMMGHTISTYHNIRMKGIEFLRSIYATSGLSIKPKTKPRRNTNKRDPSKTLQNHSNAENPTKPRTEPDRHVTNSPKTKIKQEFATETHRHAQNSINYNIGSVARFTFKYRFRIPVSIRKS